MPDWLCHIAFIYLLSFIPRLKKKEITNFDLILLIIGSVMIDFERPIIFASSWIFNYEISEIIARFLHNPFHSILGVFLLAGIIAPFFDDYSFKKAYTLLIFGGFSHLFLDMTLWPWWGGIFLFFPLQGSNFRFSFHLIWPGDFFLPLAFGLPISIIAFFHLYKDRKKYSNMVKETHLS